jgi:hypothetical protein
MRPILSFLLVCFTCLSVEAQDSKAQSLELSLWSRFDMHGKYTTQYGLGPYTDYIQLWGVSYGLGGTYRYPLTKHLYTKAGIGYYQLHVHRLWQETPWGYASERTVAYDDGVTNFGYYTPKYHYNALDLSAGAGTTFALKNKTQLTTEAVFHYYYTFSQKYILNKDNQKYKAKDSRPLGIGITAQVGWQKQLKDLYVHPQLLIPVFQRLRGDQALLEDEQLRVTKWFNGGGLSITVGKYL